MVTVRFRVLSALVVAVAALLLAACGNVTVQPGSGATDRPTSGAPSRSPVPSHSGGGSFHPGPTGIPVGSPMAVTIDGVIEAGVEPGCKVLTAGNTKYLILGGDDVPMGVPVRVEGTLQPGVLSTCQQGTPLRVTSVKRR
jgi:predicted small secreted protein